MAQLHIRDLESDEIVRSIPLKSTASGYVERVMSGLLRKMNLDEYYLDDSEGESGE